MLPGAVNYVLLAEDFWIFLATTCQTMVDVRSVFFRSLRVQLTSWAYPAININSCLRFAEDISTPADIAPSAIETIVFYCFIGYISALTYYLLLFRYATQLKTTALLTCSKESASHTHARLDSSTDERSRSTDVFEQHDRLKRNISPLDTCPLGHLSRRPFSTPRTSRHVRIAVIRMEALQQIVGTR